MGYKAIQMSHYNLQLLLNVIICITCYQLKQYQCEELPSFIHVCHKHDPNVAQCMMAAVEDIRPYLITGVPEYKIPSIEPLIMHGLISEDIAGMKISTSNVSASGCSEFFVRSINVDMDTHTFVLDVDIPKLQIEAHYSVSGKILLLPVQGDGNMEANITDCISHTVLEGELFEKDNGEKYLRFVSINLKVTLGGGVVRLENLFNGDKVLLGMINDVVNKNLDVFFGEFLPVIEKALSVVFLDIANKIVEPFTYKQLFPH